MYHILNAEIINGPTQIRHTPNGNVKFILFDSTYVSTLDLDSNCFKIIVTAL